uniref:Uncharacterized protein n=2 Tax=Anguilla anguilla TaxID=7936 RepID=A0A0E9VF94_ANGAN
MTNGSEGCRLTTALPVMSVRQIFIQRRRGPGMFIISSTLSKHT